MWSSTTCFDGGLGIGPQGVRELGVRTIETSDKVCVADMICSVGGCHKLEFFLPQDAKKMEFCSW